MNFTSEELLYIKQCLYDSISKSSHSPERDQTMDRLIGLINKVQRHLNSVREQEEHDNAF